MTLDPQVLLLKTLDRYEQQIEDCQTRDDLVLFFCTQIIPFLQTNALLEPLENEWRKKYLALAEEAEFYEKEALHEVKSVFRQLVEALKKPKKLVREKIAYINEILSGNLKNTFSLWPLSRVLYFEVKELLQLLLESGEADLCQQYASLRTVPRHIIQKKSRAIKVLEEFQIETYTFASSVEKAVQALKVIHWDQFHDPVVMWWYFEYALWCWNTSDSYFENPYELWIKEDPCFFQILNQKETWLEITRIRDKMKQKDQPIIFTSEFFKKGIKTLINAILAFAAEGFRLEDNNADPLQKMIFELKLEENQLWVFIRDHTLEPRRYYLKRFNDGPDKSCPHEFIQQLLKDYPNGGDVNVSLPNKSDSIPKAIDRLGIPKSLQRVFFGTSKGTSVHFRGTRVAVNRDERCRVILEELSHMHNQAGNPEYTENLFISVAYP